MKSINSSNVSGVPTNPPFLPTRETLNYPFSSNKKESVAISFTLILTLRLYLHL
jgi:hypothetical protein